MLPLTQKPCVVILLVLHLHRDPLLIEFTCGHSGYQLRTKLCGYFSQGLQILRAALVFLIEGPGILGGAGVTNDLLNMEAAVGVKLFNTVKDLYLTKSTASDHIQKFFDICKRKQVKPILYYTGHGEIGTGNWCFADGTISVQEILDMRPEGTYYPMIFSDACYSGHWANFCLVKSIPGFHCLAACPEYSKAIDTKGLLSLSSVYISAKFERSEV